MRQQQSDPRQRSKQDASGKSAGGDRAAREERSRRADMGVAPGQDGDEEISENQDIEEGPTRGRNEAPRTEPPRADGRANPRSREARSTRSSTKTRDRNRKP